MNQRQWLRPEMINAAHWGTNHHPALPIIPPTIPPQLITQSHDPVPACPVSDSISYTFTGAPYSQLDFWPMTPLDTAWIAVSNGLNGSSGFILFISDTRVQKINSVVKWECKTVQHRPLNWRLNQPRPNMAAPMHPHMTRENIVDTPLSSH